MEGQIGNEEGILGARSVTWLTVTYKCLRCKAEDHDKIMSTDTTPLPVLNCWSCGAGRGLDPSEMIAESKCMIPMSDPRHIAGTQPVSNRPTVMRPHGRPAF